MHAFLCDIYIITNMYPTYRSDNKCKDMRKCCLYFITQWFGAIHIFYFPFPMVQESRHSLVGSLTESLTGLQSIPAELQFHRQFQLGTSCWQKLSPYGCRICPWLLASSKSVMKRTSAASVLPPLEPLNIKGFSSNRNYLPFD